MLDVAARINAPSCDGKALGNFWRPPTEAGQAGVPAVERCARHPVKAVPRASDVDAKRTCRTGSNSSGRPARRPAARSASARAPSIFIAPIFLKKLGARNTPISCIKFSANNPNHFFSPTR